jgi:hypothetical protein
MFTDMGDYPWVLTPVKYCDIDHLFKIMPTVMWRADEKWREIRERRERFEASLNPRDICQNHRVPQKGPNKALLSDAVTARENTALYLLKPKASLSYTDL